MRGLRPGRERQGRGLAGELLGEGSEAQEEAVVSEVSGEGANEEEAGNGTSEAGHKVVGMAAAAAATSESLREAAAGCRLAAQSGARAVPCATGVWGVRQKYGMG